MESEEHGNGNALVKWRWPNLNQWSLGGPKNKTQLNFCWIILVIIQL